MPEVQPAVRARTFSHPAYGAIASLEAIDAREAAEREFELARVLRIVRANRHAEAEE